MNTNQKKAEQLGMPFGTAGNKLRKQLLFKYVKLSGDHICYKCNEEIESVDQFTIEHKEPWFNNRADLYWDLDNIAFSHSWCNRPHDTARYSQRKVGPEGTAWCQEHKEFLPIERFWKNKSRWNNYQHNCKDCHTEIRNRNR